MATERDDDADDGPFRSPLPPDDRLWRHPSEMDADSSYLPGKRKRRRGKAPASPAAPPS